MSEETIVTMKDGSTVRYRDIIGLPGYRIGSDGSVWSHRQTGPVEANKPSAEWHRLSIYRRPYGKRYCVVCFRPDPNGKVVCRYVHKLVLETFIGPCPTGMQCCHEDNDSSNNHLDNLRWDTPKGNHADKTRHGTHHRGSRSSAAKHVEMDILTVHLLRRIGFTQIAIGRLIGLSQRDISRVLKGRSWPHVHKVYKALFELLNAMR